MISFKKLMSKGNTARIIRYESYDYFTYSYKVDDNTNIRYNIGKKKYNLVKFCEFKNTNEDNYRRKYLKDNDELNIKFKTEIVELENKICEDFQEQLPNIDFKDLLVKIEEAYIYKEKRMSELEYIPSKDIVIDNNEEVFAIKKYISSDFKLGIHINRFKSLVCYYCESSHLPKGFMVVTKNSEEYTKFKHIFRELESLTTSRLQEEYVIRNFDELFNRIMSDYKLKNPINY